ncbi:MAG TPA: Gfo/Idh/MocA family oxidoreductase [Planctomycetota bacterium]|nr:Gfo/Idh/MocA family oxidoreductase [Planctomycetota bacterium]
MKIRIGQIGTGHAHASGKMAAMRRSPDFEVVGVGEADPQRRAAAERDRAYQGTKWLTEEQLLNVQGLQAVAVETEVCDLLATAARCVAAGKHIHLDKPAGESLSAFKKILDDATRQGLTVQMGYMFRYNPAFQLSFKAVREGWLGEVFEVHTVISKALPASQRAPLAKYPGGTMFELGCHVIDAVVSVLGKPDRVVPFARHSGKFGDDLKDNHLAVFEYPRATATVRSALLEVEGMQRRQFVVCGSEGTVDIRPLEPPAVRLALAQPRGDFRKGYQDVPMPRHSRYDGDFADLARIIRGEKPSDFPPAHDLAVQEAVLLASGLQTEPAG